jgi:hypothetical protein
MRPANAPKANLGLFDRLSVKLLLLFLATFLIGFLALWAYGISTSYLESSLAEAAAPQAPQPVVIDPNLRNELSQVMATTDATVEQAAIKDPFNDRGGLAGLNAVQRAIAGTATTTGESARMMANGESPSVGPGRPSRDAGPTSQGPLPPQVPAKEATKLRFIEWQRFAEVDARALDPLIFAVDDLLPVGLVDGGNGQQEVLFYSEAAARTFSFPIGTRFFDGWLSELRKDGVVFASYGERPTAKLRAWTRNLRSVG